MRFKLILTEYKYRIVSRIQRCKAKCKALKLLPLVFAFCIIPNAVANTDEAKTNEKKSFRFNQVFYQTPIKDNQSLMTLLDSVAFQESIQQMARQIAKQLSNKQFQSLSGEEQIAVYSLLGKHFKVVELAEKQRYPENFIAYRLLAKAHLATENAIQADSIERPKSLLGHSSLEPEFFERFIKTHLSKQDNHTFYQFIEAFGWSLALGRDFLFYLINQAQEQSELNVKQVARIIHNYQVYRAYAKLKPIVSPLLDAETERRFTIDTNITFKTKEGITLSAIVVQPKPYAVNRSTTDALKLDKDSTIAQLPAAFQMSIYADEKWNTISAMHAASHGYVGVVVDTRGKRLSPDKIIPWEHDGRDGHAAIDWIISQPWSNGKVVMYGGSYLGFTQWAIAKHAHPALKTIATYAAANPGMGLPMENNIFITPNYQWAFHVTNNKTMDHSVYQNSRHWNNVYEALFSSGRPFRDIDKIEGTPNPWFQKWLDHPAYDEFYQSMLPYQKDYQHIQIPVLNITGYFDGAQITALDYLKNHTQYNQQAEHYFLIGPYNHGSAQGRPREFYGHYRLDQVAMEKDTQELTFEWFDHILYRKPKPTLLKDKINYQLMGTNQWRHASSYQSLQNESQSYFLANNENTLILSQSKPESSLQFKQIIDLSDRNTQFNQYDWRFQLPQMDEPHGLTFYTEPFESPMELSGSIEGEFVITINKRDVDLGFKLYELRPDDSAFLLTRYIGRASYAKDHTKRQLLSPGEKTKVAIVNGRMIGKLIEKGSRLALVVNVNKNSGAQVNLGTGKDVSDESVGDITEPLEIIWHSESKLMLPLKPWLKALKHSK